MKKSILTLFAIATIFGACKNDPGVKPGDNNNDSGSDTYQPLTANSTWKYKESSAQGADTTTVTVQPNTKVIGDKTYSVLKSTTTGEQPQESYFRTENGTYTVRQHDESTNLDFEYQYLNDKAAVGSTWTAALGNISDEDGQYAVQAAGTIVEKDINKTVLGKNYSHVIHSRIDIQIKYPGTQNFTTVSSIDYYAAKGVGLIYSSTGANDHPNLSTTELISYTVK